MSKRKKIIWGGIGLVVVLGGIFTVVAALRLDTIATATMQRVLPVAEEALGRRVKAGQLDINLLGGFRVMVSDLAIMKADSGAVAPAATPAPAPAPQQDTAPEFAIKSVEISIKMLPLILSMGRDVSIDTIRIHGLAANLTRDEEGRLSYQDMLDRLSAASEDADESEEQREKSEGEDSAGNGGSQEIMERLVNGLAMHLFAIEDASFSLHDQSDPDNPKNYSISPLNLRITSISNGKPVVMALDATVAAAGSAPAQPAAATTTPDGQGRLVLNVETTPLNLTALLPPSPSASAASSASAAAVEDHPEQAATASTPEQPTPPKQEAIIAGLKKLHIEIHSLDLGILSRFMPSDLPVTMDGAILNTKLELANLMIPGATPISPASPARANPNPTPNDNGNTSTSALQGEPVTLKGSIAADNVLVHGGGARFNAAVSFDLAFTDNMEWVRIGALDLNLGGQTMTASGSISGLPNNPQFDDLKIATSALDLGKLAALLPGLDSALPPSSRISGVAAISVNGKGDTEKQQLQADVNLNRANLLLPGMLNKPAGTPLRLTVAAGLAGLTHGTRNVDLSKLALELGSLHLQARGHISMPPAGGGDPSIQLELKEATAPFDGLARLFPAVAESVPPEVKIAGHINLGGKVSLTHGKLDSNLTFRATELALDTPQMGLHGTMELAASTAGQMSGRLRSNVNLDMSALTMNIPQVISKKSGTPARLNIEADLDQNKDTLNISSLALVFSPLELSLKGQVNGLFKSAAAAAGPSADLSFGVAPFTVSELMEAVPSLRGKLPIPERQGKLQSLQGTIKGNLSTPEALTISINPLELQYGQSHVNLVTTTSIDAPATPGNRSKSAAAASRSARSATSSGPVRKVAVTVRSRNLDMSDFLVDRADEPEEEDSGPIDLSILKSYAGNVDVQIQKGRFKEYDFENLTADLTLAGGKASVRQMSVQAMGGKAELSGSSLDAAQSVPAIALKANLTSIQIEDLLSSLFGFDDFLSGSLNGKLEASGKGLDGKTLLASLSGSLAGAIKEGSLNGMSLADDILEPLNRSLPAGLRNRDLAGLVQKLSSTSAKGGAKSAKRTGGSAKAGTAARLLSGTNFKDMAAGFQFEQGVLKLVDKIVAQTDLGALELLGGGLSLAEGLKLDARVLFSSKTVSSLTGGNYTPAAPMPINFNIVGPISKPRIANLSLREAAQAMISGAAGKGLDDAASAILGKSVNEVKTEAVNAAKAAAEEARLKAQQAKERAEAEAKQRAKIAAQKAAAEKKRLEDEARRKAAAEKKRLEEAARREAAKKKQEAEKLLRDTASSIFK